MSGGFFGGGLALVLIAAAALCAALIVVLRPLLSRYALARPNARSSHTTPTPQGGGIAVIAATLVVAALGLFVGRLAGVDATSFLIVAAAAAAVATIGAVDDIRTIAVAPRLILQAVIVAAVLATLPAEFRVLPVLPWWAERAILLVAGIWFVNLVNFMDGLDWMTVAEIVPVSLALAVFGLYDALPGDAVVVAVALAGAMLGFAPFNRPVAGLFLGDVGSLPVGLLVGWLLGTLAARGHLAAAVILPLYYLTDATITVGRRLSKGERVWEAHRSHFYQRAVASGGFTVMQVVTRVLIVNLALAGLAAITVFAPSTATNAACFVAAIAIVALLLFSLARGRR